MGAWIEISVMYRGSSGCRVAPLVGAWIEIARLVLLTGTYTSLLSWERGLKYKKMGTKYAIETSLLSWERGLK